MEIIVNNNTYEGVDIMNKEKEQDMRILAKKLYEDIRWKIDNYYELTPADESHVLELLVKMLKMDFINYD